HGTAPQRDRLAVYASEMCGPPDPEQQLTTQQPRSSVELTHPAMSTTGLPTSQRCWRLTSRSRSACARCWSSLPRRAPSAASSSTPQANSHGTDEAAVRIIRRDFDILESTFRALVDEGLRAGEITPTAPLPPWRACS